MIRRTLKIEETNTVPYLHSRIIAIDLGYVRDDGAIALDIQFENDMDDCSFDSIMITLTPDQQRQLRDWLG